MMNTSPLKTTSLLGLLLFGGVGMAQAQSLPVTLSLLPASTLVAVGSTVNYSINLTGGTNIGGYDFNVLLNPAQLQFVPGSFMNTDANFPNINYVGPSLGGGITPGGGMEFSYTANSGVNNPTFMTLGTFQVKVLTALPITGSIVKFGTPIATNAGVSGGSEVDTFSGVNPTNELTATTGATIFTPNAAAVPESSSLSLTGLGLLGLGFMGVRRRRAAGH